MRIGEAFVDICTSLGILNPVRQEIAVGIANIAFATEALKTTIGIFTRPALIRRYALTTEARQTLIDIYTCKCAACIFAIFSFGTAAIKRANIVETN
jgi:hypothetical protein